MATYESDNDPLRVPSVEDSDIHNDEDASAILSSVKVEIKEDVGDEVGVDFSEALAETDTANNDKEVSRDVCFEFADVSRVKIEMQEEEEETDNTQNGIKLEANAGNNIKLEQDISSHRVKEENTEIGEETDPYKLYPNFKPVLRNGPFSRSVDGIYTCDVCSKKFGDNYNLTIHYRIHTGERPHVCKECGKSFTQFSNLKIHTLVHTDERPHECKECGKCFRRSAHLQKHSRLHSGKRPFVCPICNKDFICLTALKDHSFTHTMDRPHKCDSCAKTFATPARLRRHVQSHKE